MTQKVRDIELESELRNKRVVILGGSSGIGLAVAQQVVEHGAELVVASSNTQRVQQAITSLGGKAEGYTLNLTDERAIQTFFEKLGSFDHLVFTAGDTLQLGELAVADLKKARHAFELRYWAALAAAKYGSTHIRAGGSIVLTTGIAGQRPRKGWVIGASVCGTVEALTRALAVELAPIRVNAVSPGVVRTNLWQNMQEHEREGMYESVGKALLVGRVGEASDIARAYLFLMQEGFSTGQIVVVDGGTLLVQTATFDNHLDPIALPASTILIDERSDGVHLCYDRMASFLGSYGSLEALKVARELDTKVEALLAAAAT